MMTRKKSVAAFVFLISLHGFAQTAGEAVQWSTHAPASTRPGSLVTVTLQARIPSEWHIYSVSQPPGGPSRTVISLPDKQPFKQDGSLEPPPPHKGFDPNFNIDTETYVGGVQFKLPVRVAAAAPKGAQKIAIDVKFQACNETMCLPPKTLHLQAATQVTSAPAK